MEPVSLKERHWYFCVLILNGVFNETDGFKVIFGTTTDNYTDMIKKKSIEELLVLENHFYSGNRVKMRIDALGKLIFLEYL
jgi:hypothetical protein